MAYKNRLRNTIYIFCVFLILIIPSSISLDNFGFDTEQVYVVSGSGGYSNFTPITLSGSVFGLLPCADNQILKMNGADWNCEPDESSPSSSVNMWIDNGSFLSPNSSYANNVFANKLLSPDWSNVTITESQISDLQSYATSNCNSSGACIGGDVCYINYQNTGTFNTSGNIYSTSGGFVAADQSTFVGGNGNIVATNGGGAASFTDTSGVGGAVDFAGNTASIGISSDGIVSGYDYDGAFVFKQKGSNPDGVVEFLFLEESGDWRFALPSSGADYGTYNPRSFIIAGTSTNNASSVSCSYWGFDNIDCDTIGTGADLGVQDDLEVLGKIYSSDWSNVSITESQISDLQSYEGQLNNEAGLYAALSDVSEFIETNDAATLATLDTGHGANELYAMNQNVRTTDNVTFDNVTIDSIYMDGNLACARIEENSTCTIFRSPDCTIALSLCN